VRVDLVERVPGSWELSTRTAPTRKDANEMRWELDLQPGAKAEVVYSVTRHTGTRAK
jgi:hypothetical protein